MTRHQDMVSVDNLGRKLCGILQSKSFRGNDVEFKYNVTGYKNRGSVKKKDRLWCEYCVGFLRCSTALP